MKTLRNWRCILKGRRIPRMRVPGTRPRFTAASHEDDRIYTVVHANLAELCAPSGAASIMNRIGGMPCCGAREPPGDSTLRTRSLSNGPAPLVSFFLFHRFVVPSVRSVSLIGTSFYYASADVVPSWSIAGWLPRHVTKVGLHRIEYLAEYSNIYNYNQKEVSAAKILDWIPQILHS